MLNHETNDDILEEEECPSFLVEYFSPIINGPQGAGDGKLKVKAIDFCGQESTWSVVVDFHEQSGWWCENPYPIWCECCSPDPNLPPMAVMNEGEVLFQTDKATANLSDEITIAPNPFTNELEIETFSGEPFSLRILTLDGRAVVDMQNLTQSKVAVSLKGKPTGLYLVCIYTAEGVKVEKVWKQE